MEVRIKIDRLGCVLVTSAMGKELFIQSDLHKAELALALGWPDGKYFPSYGTEYCPPDLITSAIEWLDEHDGETFEVDEEILRF